MPNHKRQPFPPDHPAIIMYRDELKTIPEVARHFGLAITTMRLKLIASGVKLRNIREALKVSQFDWVAHGRRSGKRKKGKEEKEKIRIARLLAPCRGISQKPSGYIEHTVGENKGRGVHVTVMESIIGRRLNKNECVHHKDRNRSNNSPDNLQLMTRSAHTALHRKEGW